MAQAFAYYNYKLQRRPDPRATPDGSSTRRDRYSRNTSSITPTFRRATSLPTITGTTAGGAGEFAPGWDTAQNRPRWVRRQKSLGQELEISAAFASCRFRESSSTCACGRRANATDTARWPRWRLVQVERLFVAASLHRRRCYCTAGINMNLKRIVSRASASLVRASPERSGGARGERCPDACGGGGAPTTATGATAPTSSANPTRTGAGDGRRPGLCGQFLGQCARAEPLRTVPQCHLPAQMPNSPQRRCETSPTRRPTGVICSSRRLLDRDQGERRTQCWLADPNACGEI